jgi:hypothetical protein
MLMRFSTKPRLVGPTAIKPRLALAQPTRGKLFSLLAIFVVIWVKKYD